MKTILPAATHGGPMDEASRTFDDFFRLTHRRVFTAMCLVTGDRNEAEEIVQDAYLRVLERWDRIVNMDDPEGYLFSTAMNVFRNRYRRATRVVRRAVTLAPAPRDELATVEARDELVRLLQPLAPRQRAAVLATSILDLSADEAGRLLGMKAATVRALSSRARKQLRENEREETR